MIPLHAIHQTIPDYLLQVAAGYTLYTRHTFRGLRYRYRLNGPSGLELQDAQYNNWESFGIQPNDSTQQYWYSYFQTAATPSQRQRLLNETSTLFVL